MSSRYAIAIGCVANAFLVRRLLDPSLGDQLPLAAFMLAVCATIWLAGTGPSLLATLGGAFLADYYFMAPRMSLWIADPGDLIRLLLFVFASVVFARAGESIRAAREQSHEAESKVRAHEDTLRSTLASLRDAIIKTDPAGKVLYLNPIAETWTGMTTAQAAGRELHEVLPGREVSGVPSGAPDESQAFYPGIGKWVRSRVASSVDGGSVIVLSDISDRKQFDRLQAGQQAVLERIARGAPLEDVLAQVCHLIEEQEPGLLCSILLLDRARRQTMKAVGPSLNPSFVKSLEGIGISSPYTGSCCAALDSGAEIVVPDILSDDRWMDVWRELNLSNGLRACRSVPVLGQGGDILASVAIFRRTAGDPGPKNRLLLGIATHLVGIAVEKERVESRIRMSEERTRLLWESARILLTADDPDSMLKGTFGRIAEHLRLDGYLNYIVADSGDELTLKSQVGIPEETAAAIRRLEFGQAICGRVAVRKQPMVATCIQTSTDPTFELVKSLGFTAYVCNPLVAGDRLLGTLSFATRRRDGFEQDELEFLATISKYVTTAYERLSLISRLQEADRRKDQFLATLAHELRNPLAPLQNGLQILQLPVETSDEAAQVSDMMFRQLNQMVRLIDDLLDISRITRGKVSLRKERIEIQRAIHQALETVQPTLKAGEHELVVDIPPEAIYVSADLTRLSQVIANLLSNACKYTTGKGRISLSLAREGDDAVVRVQDTGIGIPSHMLPRIFDMFTQVDPSLEKSQGGLGIGLSLVKGLIELHGGRVEVKSDGPNRGSEFAVRLPVILSVVAQDESDHRLPRVASGRRRILVVDDNRDAATSLAVLLRSLGNEVETAFNGAQGLSQASSFRPDTVFLDIGMPELNGYEVAKRMRQETWGRDLLLVALTGWGQESDRRNSREAGFDAHLVKPAELDSIVRVLSPAASKLG